MREELKTYIDTHILPRYHHFDAAHQLPHALQVIRNSAQLAQHYPVDAEMVYAVAAYHDIGLAEGREQHHLASGRMLRADTQLCQWFSPEQIETMAQAVEDHRASAQSKPRSIYGLIVAEADRNIEPLDIIRRTYQYGISHYPDLDADEQWQRCHCHLIEKYGRNGYLKLWLPESPNAAPLRQLQDLIDNETALKETYLKIVSEASIE